MNLDVSQVLASLLNAAQSNQPPDSTLERLITAIHRLCDCLERISNPTQQLNRTPDVPSATIPPQPRSYASTLKANPITNSYGFMAPRFNPVNQMNTARINQNTTANVHGASELHSPQIKSNSNVTSNAFMAELAKIKNIRNEACYRMKRNIAISALMEKNLSQNPIRIPKKFAPSVSHHDGPDIKCHKISVAIQNTRNDIKTMLIHRDLQEKKMHLYDEKVREHIQTEPNEEKRNNLRKNYEAIIKKHNDNADNKLRKKSVFLDSSAHMYTLKMNTQDTTHTQHQDADNTIPSNTQADVDENSDHTSEDEILAFVTSMETENSVLKRKSTMTEDEPSRKMKLSKIPIAHPSSPPLCVHSSFLLETKKSQPAQNNGETTVQISPE